MTLKRRTGWLMRLLSSWRRSKAVRAFLAVAVVGLLAVVDLGALGGLMILALPFLYLRGVWRFAGDLRRLGRPRR